MTHDQQDWFRIGVAFGWAHGRADKDLHMTYARAEFALLMSNILERDRESILARWEAVLNGAPSL